ncbi:hypothetical protein TSA1_36635 [Bradyrhizobium nitroreducens]|uniref:Uncharacterized protein n=2 Tax=Bradyrhizobium nitroreducens TaxID=709803 RepID=A0A2M6UM44_9BRAD|nr:hypothetical protein TSA1_36635 [Bradyrhizobium nitroreducens]
MQVPQTLGDDRERVLDAVVQLCRESILMQSHAEADYHWINIETAINSTKKTGSKTGGTSHSRRMNPGESDILTASWSRRERNALSHR